VIRKWSIASLIGAAAVVGLIGTASSSLDISIQPPISYAEVGDTVAISVRVVGQDSVGWFWVEIHTDSTVLTYVKCIPGITTGCPRQSGCMECGPTGEPGMVSVTCACWGTGTCVAPGTLVTIKYVAIADGTSPVEFDVAYISDCNRTMIPFGTVQEGQVIVGTASVDPQDQPGDCTIASFSCHPNPFASGITLQYRVGDASGQAPSADTDTELRIYNCLGRLVRHIPAGLSPGDHNITWDGTDDAGRAISPGTYFCRFPATYGVKTYKVVKAN
jgi:hypothetical protein